MDYLKLSKTMSYALRHAPWEYELVLDERGWVNIAELLCTLQEESKWKTLRKEDIYHVVATCDKKRYEIDNDKIRASYGHSIPQKIIRQPIEPPEILYHGTTHEVVSLILNAGLQPKGRQYVHMSIDQETAFQVGKRRDFKPVLLVIEAKKAWSEGVSFYNGNDKIWLADFVPEKYIKMIDGQI